MPISLIYWSARRIQNRTCCARSSARGSDSAGMTPQIASIHVFGTLHAYGNMINWRYYSLD